ncbi:hypothetical protein EBZ70_13055, partial [bacterium]|nr:hypothetical protein [bacterium]
NFGAGDPDKTQDMTAFVGGLDALRLKFSTTVLVVHHSGKDAAKGARNSSVLRAAVDVEIRAEREEKAQRVKLINTKQKDGEEFRDMWLTLDPVEVTDPRTGEVTTSLVVRGDSADDKPVPMAKPGGRMEAWVLSVLAQRETLTLSEIIGRDPQVDKSNVKRALRGLLEKGLVKRGEGSPQTFWKADQYQQDERETDPN